MEWDSTRQALVDAGVQHRAETVAGTGFLACVGENREVYQVLEKTMRNRISCAYLDPPYNNQETYHYYSDALEHAQWLEGFRERVSTLLPLMASHGSLWISLDDNEMHYAKVELDKILGRENFINTVVWNHRKTRENRSVFSNNHEYILVYAINPRKFKKYRSKLDATESLSKRYRNPDSDIRGPWQSVSLHSQNGHGTDAQFYTIISPAGAMFDPPDGRCWVYSQSRLHELIADDRIWFGANGDAMPRLKRFKSESDLTVVPNTLWLADEVGTTQSAKRMTRQEFPELEIFDTPKPKELLARIISIGCQPGDVFLEPYMGTGPGIEASLLRGCHYIGIERSKQAFQFANSRIDSCLKSHLEGTPA